jgi:hypothetical protein
MQKSMKRMGKKGAPMKMMRALAGNKRLQGMLF